MPKELMLDTQEVTDSSSVGPTTAATTSGDSAYSDNPKAGANAANFAQLLPSQAIPPGLVTIKLTRGKVALIDKADLPKISLFKWRAKQNCKNWYAVTGSVGSIFMHRLIADAKPGQRIDHWDGNGLHNWRDNLRLCTNAENVRNARVYSRKVTSKYKGVYFNRETGKFRAQIMMLGKKINLGDFDNSLDAARAYDANAKKLFGNFARVNFPDQA